MKHLTRSRASRVMAVAAVAAALVLPGWPTTAVAEPAVSEASGGSAALVVATFNVRCANCSINSRVNSREKRWYDRGPVVAAQILAEKVDVVGVQEASPGLLHSSAYGAFDGKAQFENLVGLLNAGGANYAVTNPNRYNCKKSTTFTSCSKEDQGASQDARIIYNTDTVSLVPGRVGSLALDGRSIGNGSARYMAWAELVQSYTGKHFIFATAHFEPGTSSGKTSTRVAQVKKAVAKLNEVNTDDLPIIWGSDLASSKLTHTGNKSYDAFIGAGYTDPLGNKYKCHEIPAGAELTPSTAVNEQYFTLNNFAKGPKDYVSKGYKLGAHLDYILTRGDVETTSWKEVLNLTSSGNFSGVIPSDHNMVRATVVLG